jgi:hypothetical protein
MNWDSLLLVHWPCDDLLTFKLGRSDSSCGWKPVAIRVMLICSMTQRTEKKLREHGWNRSEDIKDSLLTQCWFAIPGQVCGQTNMQSPLHEELHVLIADKSGENSLMMPI